MEGKFNYFMNVNTDFQFEINDVVYSGRNNWQLQNVQKHTDARKGEGASITLLSEDKKLNFPFNFFYAPAYLLFVKPCYKK